MRGKLRLKKLKFDKSSYIIDYYPPVWNPIQKKYIRRETLKLQVYNNPQSSLERQINGLNKELAEKIYLKRMKSLVLDSNGLFNRDVLEADVYEYAKRYIRAKSAEGIDTDHYVIAIKYIKKWVGDHLKFRHIDEHFLAEFKKFLLSTTSIKSARLKLAQNSAASYYDKFALIIFQAFRDKYLPEDYTSRVDRISNVKHIAKIVDDEDLAKLINNPPQDIVLYKSSILALMTGLRFSAIEILRFSDFAYSNPLKTWYIEIIDPKPERSFRLYIHQDVIDFIGPIPESNELIFPGINYHTIRLGLQYWFACNGLLDKAKFHNWRRKYATNLAEKGTDIYVISKLLNHMHVKTTEVYIQGIEPAHAEAAKKTSYSIIKNAINGNLQFTQGYQGNEDGHQYIEETD